MSVRLAPRSGVAAGLAALWGLSLALPVGDAVSKDGPAAVIGAMVLIMGFAGVIILQFGWFANVWVIAIWIALAQRRAPHLRTVLELTGVMALLLVNATFWDGAMPDDAGSGLRVTRFGIGYYLWFAVMIGSVGSLLVRAKYSSRET
jgi:hypothetical protein